LVTCIYSFSQHRLNDVGLTPGQHKRRLRDGLRDFNGAIPAATDKGSKKAELRSKNSRITNFAADPPSQNWASPYAQRFGATRWRGRQVTSEARTVEAGVSPAFLLIVFSQPTRLPLHKSLVSSATQAAYDAALLLLFRSQFVCWHAFLASRRIDC
jgi:hypothetical protein